MFNLEIIWTLVGLVSLLFVDLVLGLALAIKRGEFSWSRVANTLKTNFLPYIVSLSVLGGAASLSRPGPAEPMAAFFLAFSGLYAVKLLADIGEKVRLLFSVSVR